MLRSLRKIGRQVQQAWIRSSADSLVVAEPCCSHTPSRSYSKLPADYEQYYKAAASPVKRPQAAPAAEPVAPSQPADANAAPALAAADAGLAEQQRRGAAAVTRWMLPWERAQMDGKQGPLKSWEKLYWGVFVSALAALLFSRLWGKDAPKEVDSKAAEEKEQRRMLAARLLLAGESFVGDGQEDAFEGLSPKEIQVYVDKVTGGASASDPFEGMSPEEINEIMSTRKLAR